MAKLAVIFFAALAFQAVFALHEEEQRSHEVQDLLKQVQSVSSDASKIIENVKPEDSQNIHALYSQANELAHNIHEVVYHLQEVVYQNQEGEGEEVLREVVGSLSEIVHFIERAIHYEPYQLKTKLTEQVHRISTEAQKLSQVAQHEQSSEEINDDIEDALDDLLVAIEQLQARNRLQHKSEEEIKSQIHEVYEEVTKVVDGIKSEDNETVERLVHHAHHLAHHVGEIVHRLDREVHDYQGEVLTTIEQVISKLGAIRSSLEQIGYSQDKIQVADLKNQIKIRLHEVAGQIEKLVHVPHYKNLSEHDAQHLRDLIESVIARSIVVARQFQRQVEFTSQNHQEN